MEYMRVWTLHLHIWEIYRARIASMPRTPIAPLPTVAMGAAAPSLVVEEAAPAELEAEPSEPEPEPEVELESEPDSESEPLPEPVEVEEAPVLVLVTMEPEASVL